MKKLIGAAAICILVSVALILFFFWQKNRPSQPGPGAGTQAPIGSATSSLQDVKAVNTSSNATGTALTPAGQSESATAGTLAPEISAPPTNLPPEIILQSLRRCVHQYGEMFGGNPVGTNPEITAALTGKNPKQINFLTGQPGVRINQDGELIDAWGTPYFFHQLSATDMEIHSAGPDKIMWTSDDLVTQ